MVVIIHYSSTQSDVKTDVKNDPILGNTNTLFIFEIHPRLMIYKQLWCNFVRIKFVRHS